MMESYWRRDLARANMTLIVLVLPTFKFNLILFVLFIILFLFFMSVLPISGFFITFLLHPYPPLLLPLFLVSFIINNIPTITKLISQCTTWMISKRWDLTFSIFLLPSSFFAMYLHWVYLVSEFNLFYCLPFLFFFLHSIIPFFCFLLRETNLLSLDQQTQTSRLEYWCIIYFTIYANS